MQERLAQTGWLMQPMRMEMGLWRPVFSENGADLSLQLASVAYTLEMAPWREAGWKDISYLIDNSLFTGEETNGTGVMGEYKQFMARLKLKGANLLGQVLGTVRNREESDTCKAVVMCRKDECGRYLVALGFMGTGRRLYDWMANFRIADEQGMHMGCLQLTRHFEEKMPEILFPETARELGLEKLTLQDIFQECTRPDSRFKLWLSGHSQGGAVMQLFAYRAILEGVMHQHLIGYSFAAPSVMYHSGSMNLASVPLFHLVSTDDLTPRVGARLHIGTCLSFRPTEEMRRACYGKAWEDRHFRQVFSLVQRVRCNRDALLFLLALIHRMEQLSDLAAVQAISEILGRLLPDKMLGLLGGRVDEALRGFAQFVERKFALSTGDEPLPEGLLAVWEGHMERLMQAMGPRQFVKYLLQVLAIPHRMRRKDSYGATTPAYAYAVEKETEGLQGCIMPQYAPVDGRQRQVLRQQRRRPQGRFGYAMRRNSEANRRKSIVRS